MRVAWKKNSDIRLVVIHVKSYWILFAMATSVLSPTKNNSSITIDIYNIQAVQEYLLRLIHIPKLSKDLLEAI